ncbi:MAG: proline--tRNA ligase [Aquificaceae bacterium]|nr:proline--tRNA ligase [Aquificaceae bacterium]
MRWSSYFWYTLKETPSDAEAPSHKLSLKAGLIKQVSSGIYHFTPPGYKVISKIESIIRKEMNLIGAQELLLSILSPSELWQETGRWELYGEELFKLKDRKGKDFCLGPTHEESITVLVRGVLRSYKNLPMLLYQIQVKFRDEKRPRFGLIRAREFIMKDAYSFDKDEIGARLTYQSVQFAYERIFKKLGINVVCAQASVGSIGGLSSHEYIAITPYGEAKIAYCDSCGYCANAEITPFLEQDYDQEQELESLEVPTPNVNTIEALSKFLSVQESKILKAMLYLVNQSWVMVLIRGDRSVDEDKLASYLQAEDIRLAKDEEVASLLGTSKGFIGPINLPKNIRLIWDQSTVNKKNWVVAKNVPDLHILNANIGKELPMQEEIADLCQIQDGDICPVCKSALKIQRGLELGHVFLLGTRYSAPMKAVFTDQNGTEAPLFMGCYGIGVSRLLPAIIEQNNDQLGIIWPANIAPFEAVILCVNPSDKDQWQVSNELYQSAMQANIDVILDDRDQSPGSKLADSDLCGFPIKLIVGKRLKEGLVELQVRKTGEKITASPKEAINLLKELLDKLRELS